jgi:HK97 family phage major capsid protein
VPTSFYDRLVAHLIETAQVLSYSTVLNTEGGESLAIPKTTAHSSAAIVTEWSPIAAPDPTFNAVNLGAFKYGLLIQVSRELVTDSGVDLEGICRSRLAVPLVMRSAPTPLRVPVRVSRAGLSRTPRSALPVGPGPSPPRTIS